jgi:hypothetical protein
MWIESKYLLNTLPTTHDKAYAVYQTQLPPVGCENGRYPQIMQSRINPDNGQEGDNRLLKILKAARPSRLCNSDVVSNIV